MFYCIVLPYGKDKSVMGKKSKAPQYPEYSNGAVTINGKKVATATKKGNTVSTNYNMSKNEKSMLNSIQGNMNNSLKNLFNISDNQKNLWTQQLDAMKTQGINSINEIYTPMENNLRNNVASRFGNLDNSVFLNNLNRITDKRAQAAADLSNTLMAAQNNLYNEELSNRINTLSFLSGLNTQLNNNILGYLNAASANAGAGNSYNQNAYQAQWNAYNANRGNSFLDTALKIGTTAASFV